MGLWIPMVTMISIIENFSIRLMWKIYKKKDSAQDTYNLIFLQALSVAIYCGYEFLEKNGVR